MGLPGIHSPCRPNPRAALQSGGSSISMTFHNNHMCHQHHHHHHHHYDHYRHHQHTLSTSAYQLARPAAPAIRRLPPWSGMNYRRVQPDPPPSWGKPLHRCRHFHKYHTYHCYYHQSSAFEESITTPIKGQRNTHSWTVYYHFWHLLRCGNTVLLLNSFPSMLQRCGWVTGMAFCP